MFDNTEDKKGYAKALGKLILLLGVGIAVTGITAAIIQGFYSIIISIIILFLFVIIVGIWFVKIQKQFNKLYNKGQQ